MKQKFRLPRPVSLDWRLCQHDAPIKRNTLYATAREARENAARIGEAGPILLLCAPLLTSPVRRRTSSLVHKQRINKSRSVHSDRHPAHLLLICTLKIVKWPRPPSTSPGITLSPPPSPQEPSRRHLFCTYQDPFRREVSEKRVLVRQNDAVISSGHVELVFDGHVVSKTQHLLGDT